MLPISVCIIAKNEEQNIENCLRPLREYDWEIIVVDTGSTDHTKEISGKYADRVLDFVWCDDFSAARNYSIEQASHDLILVIDSDEYLTEIDVVLILRLAEQNPTSIGLLSRKNHYQMNGTDSVYVDLVERLFSRKYYHYEGIIHEQVCTLDGREPDSFQIPLTFYHEGYVSESGKRMRATRNLELLLHDLELKGPSPFIYYQLGQNYISLNDLEKAVQYYQKGLKLNADPNSAIVQSMVETYGYCLIELAKYDMAMELQKIYDQFSNRADFIYLMGMIYMKKGIYDKAIEEFQKATTFSSCSRKGINSYQANYNIAAIYENMGKLEEARTYYKKCGDYAPAVRRLKEIAAS